MNTPPPKRILIVRFGAIGDIVLTLPAVAALKKAWPDTHITYLTKVPFRTLVEPHPAVDDVMLLEKGESIGSLRARIKAAQIDGIVDLHSKMRSRVMRWLHSSPTLCAKPSRNFWEAASVRLGWSTHEPRTSIVEDHHRLIDDIVGYPVPRENIQFSVESCEVETVHALLREQGFDFDRPALGISPGANWFTKRWPTEHFAEIARRALDSGIQVVATGSPAEKPLGETIAKRASVINLFGAPLAQLGPIIQASSVFLANDSGPMHIARGLGIPTVAIFGSTSPMQFDFNGHQFLFSKENCSPCHFYGRHECPKGHLDCLNNISVEQVWKAIESITTH